MGRYALELRMLKSISKKFRDAEKIYDGDPAGLEAVYDSTQWPRDDPWHVKLKIRTRYCSMDELKEYLVRKHPDAELSPSWSMTGGYGGRDVSITTYTGEKIVIPYPEYEAIQTDHIDERVFENQMLCWSLDLGCHDRDWLEPLLPGYVDTVLLGHVADMRYEFARKSAPDARTDRISEAGYTGTASPDVLGFLADGLAEAKSRRCALYACLVD